MKFVDGQGPAGMAALHASGAQVVIDLAPQNAVAVRLPSQATAGLARNPHIEYVEEDVIREPMALSNRPLPSGETLPYGVQMVQADLVTSTNEGGKKICIIDSGCSQQHQDLRDATDGSITNSTNTEDVAFNAAYKRGMLHVAAAGNAGNTTTSYPAGLHR